jgi:enoyl-CoA hydratase
LNLEQSRAIATETISRKGAKKEVGEMDYQTILYEVRNQIAFVTFNRPESMNAVNRQMARELVEACGQIEDDAGIRIAIFTGAGEKAFSAGMDLKERAESGSSPIERRRQKLSATIHTQTRAVAAITKPTIAAIRGYCVGGGLEFALACDMRVAAEDAKLGLAEVKRGLIPGAGGTQRLARTVGVAKALEICLTGDNVAGSEAQRLGLVNIAVPASDVIKAAEDLAGRILKGAPMSVLFIKEAIKKGVELSLDEGFRLESDLSALVGTTEDSKEGPRAFAEKRPPVWKGR